MAAGRSEIRFLAVQTLEDAPATRSDVRTQLFHILLARFLNALQILFSADRFFGRSLCLIWRFFCRIGRSRTTWKPETGTDH